MKSLYVAYHSGRTDTQNAAVNGYVILSNWRLPKSKNDIEEITEKIGEKYPELKNIIPLSFYQLTK